MGELKMTDRIRAYAATAPRVEIDSSVAKMLCDKADRYEALRHAAAEMVDEAREEAKAHAQEKLVWRYVLIGACVLAVILNGLGY